MEDIVRIFKSPEGDVYHITLSEDNGVLSAEVLAALGKVHVAGIDLRRLFGKHVTNTSKNTMPPQEYRSRLSREDVSTICQSA